jgi:hypothetical protein
MSHGQRGRTRTGTRVIAASPAELVLAGIAVRG